MSTLGTYSIKTIIYVSGVKRAHIAFYLQHWFFTSSWSVLLKYYLTYLYYNNSLLYIIDKPAFTEIIIRTRLEVSVWGFITGFYT